MAGLATVSAVVVDGDMAPGELLAVQLVENCLREDLNAVEQARAFLALIEQHGWSIRQLAAELDLDHSAVAKTIKLAGLPEAVQGLVERGELPTWTAFEVAKAETPELQEEVARIAVAEGLTAAETAEAVRRRSGRKPAAKGRGRKLTARVFRTPTARVSVELRKGEGLAAIRAALADAMASIDAETGVEG